MGVAVVVGLLLIALAWFFWPSRGSHAPPRSELEAAEQDVQEASDPDSVRDWGPGTGQKPLP
ncbi:MAG TPA: hypothetical protein VGU74_04995 [Gemmatimonadales bacterium]|nr:hypothetical protein [Gemmatimonadales bacterium]